MKGVLFNVVEDVVDDTLPAGTWDGALELAACHGAYTSLGDYPDAELAGIVASVSSLTGLDRSEVLRHAGRHGFSRLADRHPELLEGVDDLDGLLRRLDDVIHPEVLKLYPQAQPPSFRVDGDGAGTWAVEYSSRRELCHLAEGLIMGAGDHFGTPVEVHQTSCTQRGDDRCVLQVSRS